MQNPVATVAQKYPECRFAIIDSVVDLPNVQSLSFQDEEGAFLMGIIAGKTTRTNKIGFIGGQDIPLIKRFEAGFAAGVKAVNPRAAEGLINRDGKSPGDQVKFCGNFQDSDKGYEIAQAMYGSGCDIIYHRGRGSRPGIIQSCPGNQRQGSKGVGAGD
jgi:basic membrane protein A